MPIPSSVQAVTSHNFVGAAQLLQSALKPQYENKLYKRYGDQNMVGLISLLGGMNPIAGLEFMHSEQDWLHEILMVSANNSNYGAGAMGTYTIAAPYQYSYPSAPISPYISSTTTATSPLLATGSGEIIEFPNGVQAVVDVVTATTFTCFPKISTESLPNTTVTDEIIIVGVQKQEGSTVNGSHDFRTILYKNDMQISDGSHESTGSAMAEQIWFEAAGLNGKKGWLWYYMAQLAEYVTVRNKREVQMLIGKKTTNTTLANTAGYDTSMSTEGLIPFIENYGNIANWNNINGITLQNWENMITTQLDRNIGSYENAVYAAIELRKLIDRFIRIEMKAGGVTYNMFDGDEKQAVNFGFDGFKSLGYTFLLKTYNVFNYKNLLGADGHKYKDMAIIVPTDKKVRTIGYEGKSEMVPNIRMNYQSQKPAGGTLSRDWEEWVTGGTMGVYTNQTDKVSINWRSTYGFEGFAANRFVAFEKI